MARHGKIARLPRALREEVNRRLQNGMTGRGIVAWLNSRQDVQEMTAAQFGGTPVSEQNLTEWKQGGYAEWLSRRELVEEVREKAGDAEELAAAGGPLADHAARMLSARFMLAMAEWDGEPEHPAMAKLRALSSFSRELIALRRGDHSAARLKMEQVRFDKQEAAEEEVDEMEARQMLRVEFQKWLQLPEIRRAMENGRMSGAERIEALARRVWGDLAGWSRTPDERKQIQANRAINGDGI